MSLRIERQPLVGVDSTPYGNVKVEHDVCTILGHFTDGEGQTHLLELGQVGKKPGSPVSYRCDRNGRHFPAHFKAAAEAAIAEYHGGQKVTRTSQEPEWAEEEVDDDEEDTVLADE